MGSPRTQLLIGTITVVILATITVALGVGLTRFAPQLGVPGSSAAAAESGHVTLEPTQQCSHCHLAKHKAPLVGPCDDCHTTTTWLSERSHETTAMDAGRHTPLRCVQCHANPNVLPSPKCQSCHRTVAHLPEQNCDRCHSAKSWKDTRFSTPEKHQDVVEGHKTLKCPDCHQLNTGSTIGPPLAKLPAKTPPPRCKSCHKKHTKDFALVGQHQKLRCAQCHNVNAKRDNLNRISIKATQCVQCHKQRHAGYPDCAKCHTTKFAKTQYAHNGVWPLVGAHKKAACDTCHPKQQWNKVPGTACAACHKPRHSALTNCARCHSPLGFRMTTFSHSTVFALKGTHSNLKCARCHPGGDIGRVKGTACAQCHSVKHGGLKACAKCHGSGSFSPTTFKHNRVWARTGAHARLKCSACHPKKQYAKTKGRDCVQCHYRKHAGQTRCATCHTTSGWTPIKTVVHSDKYPLLGQHRFVECRACHKQLKFNGTPTRCNDCHADLSHGHPNCEGCHTPRAWKFLLPHDMKECL